MSKDKKERKPAEPPEWDKIKQFSVVLFQSVRGPIMGLADPKCRRWSSAVGDYVWGVDGIVRLWAPANVGMPDERHVMWMPLMFCEEFVDLRIESAAFFGTGPVPDVVKLGYMQYVEEFMQGSYKMKPLLVEAGVDGVKVIKEDTRVPEAPPEEPKLCGSCGGTTAAHKDNCPTQKPSTPCATCKHPGHSGRACQMPTTEQGTEPCGCVEYVPTLSSVPPEPAAKPVDLGQAPPPVPRAPGSE